MHFLFSLLIIKALYMFQTLVAYLQEAPHNDIWYTVCVVCQLAEPGAANWHNTHNTPIVVCEAPPEDEQVMLETCRSS
jgi:hypothetical protein